MSPVYRRVSPSEWGYLAAARVFPPLAVQLWIEADSVPAISALEGALARAAEANRGARIVRRGRWWHDSGLAPRVHEIPAGEFNPAHAVLHREFPSADAPALEVWNLGGRGLLFRGSHALMDARGLLFFAEETFRALRGEAPLGSTRVVSDRDYLRGFAHPKRRGFPGRSSASPLASPLSAAGAAGFVWAQRSLGGETPALNARLQGAIAQLALRRAPDRAVRFMIPVDLRQQDAALRTTTNLSNALLPEFAQLEHWSQAYERTLKALSDHDERAIEPFDVMVPWIPLPLLARLQENIHTRCVASDRYLFSAVVSHVGRISLARLSCPGFAPHRARFMSFDAPASALTLVISQHDHGAEICASAPGATAGGALESALDEICAAVADAPPARRASPTGPPTVAALFAEQVLRTPQNRAVSDATTVLTYAELDARAQGWAARLRDAGVAPGDRVAIHSVRSIETVAALLGVLRAGASFVPVDVDWPADRVAFVLRDCAARCVIADSQLRMNEPRRSLASEAPPSGIAYVMYTSGSTGQPKGVVIAHSSLSNYLQWARAAYCDSAQPPVFPLFTSLAFDLTLTALLVPLVSGGEVRVFAEREPLLAARAIVADRTLTAIKLTPSHLRLLCEVGFGESRLRTFIVGGETLRTELAASTARQNKDAAIFNEYGPTEATVGCIVHRFDASRDLDASVPIGQPIANTQIFLLDERGLPVAPGSIGEICIAGACLALGYLSPSAEDRRFAGHEGAPIYRSGDFGSIGADGAFRYHGRGDEQVKVLGHRVELAEVERAVEASGLVESVAVAVDRSTGNEQLVAFVVWRGAPDVASLRAGLASSLPAYMIPSRVAGIESLPLTINGKVDRHALPAPLPGGLADEIRNVLADLLGVAPRELSVDRPIHEQGCDSLQMAIFLSRVSERCLSKEAAGRLFGNLGDFLRAPTIHYLAQLGGCHKEERPRVLPA